MVVYLKNQYITLNMIAFKRMVVFVYLFACELDFMTPKA